MMSAKEMFEKLGYNQLYKHKKYMFYEKELVNSPQYENDVIHLSFDFENKTFSKTYGDDNTTCEITLEELQAINKQVEELNERGWNDVKD